MENGSVNQMRLILKIKNEKRNDEKKVKSKAIERFHRDHVPRTAYTAWNICFHFPTKYQSVPKRREVNGRKIAHRWARKSHRWIVMYIVHTQTYKLTNVDPIAGQLEFKYIQ